MFIHEGCNAFWNMTRSVLFLVLLDGFMDKRTWSLYLDLTSKLTGILLLIIIIMTDMIIQQNFIKIKV